MAPRKNLKLLLILFVLSLAGTGCAVKRGAGLAYDAANVRQLPSSDFKIAVVPFEDRISGYPKKGTYFSDLVAQGLQLDLQKSDAARVVHFSPEMRQSYDLIIDGSIGSLSEITYRIRSPYKEFSKKVLAYKAGGNPDSNEQLDTFRYFTKVAQDHNTAFLKDVAPAIEKLMGDVQNLNTVRTLRFYYSLDPELEKILRTRATVKSTPQVQSPYYQRLVGEIGRRQKMLNQYKKVEENVVSKKQAVRLQAQQQRVNSLLNLGTYERSLEEHEEQIDEMNSATQMSQVTGAIVSGILPTLQAVGTAAAGGGGFGTWHREHTFQAIRDTSNALGAAPDVELVEKPDYQPYYANLDKKAYQLKQAKADPFAGKRNSSIREMRKRFLRQYRSKIVPLGELR